MTTTEKITVVPFQRWMLENEEFLDRIGQHFVRRMVNSICERGEVDWEEVINGLSEDMAREICWLAPRATA
ncbi:MAG: hypothetical protein HC882_07680 [Acidobacteria bacterium]|nr:hypothetical protein [Acidobacteriota bacterium]